MASGPVGHLRQNAVAYLALFVALGGTTYAAVQLPPNSVGTKQIKKAAVNGKKVKDGSLTGKDVKDGSLTASDVSAAPLVVTGAEVSDDSLTGADIEESTLGGLGAGVMTGRINALSGSIVNGGPPMGTSTGTAASFFTYQTVSPAVATVATDFTFRLSASPGAGKSREVSFVVNGFATPVCTIADTATSCTSSTPITLPASTSFSVQTAPSGSPADADLSFGYRLITTAG